MISLNKDSLREWQDNNLEYLRYEYSDLKPGDKILDIGSYQREWAIEMTRRYMVTVECFDALDNKAAWVFDGELKMGGAFYYTSMFTLGEQTFKCVDIAPYLRQQIEVCKINIEGGEYALINYILDRGLMGNIVNLQVQFHLIDGIDCEAGYASIAERLSLTHKLTWRYPFCWESWELK